MKTKRLRLRPLTIREILSWADAHREATGKWPKRASGTIFATRFETWAQIDSALRHGLRGLPGGGSLAKLLAQKQGARNPTSNLPLTEQKVLAWADAHHRRTGEWPTAKAVPIPGSGGETWAAIDTALRTGTRSLAGGSSLARLLAEHRGVRNHMALPPLTMKNILAWADRHHERTGSWPGEDSGNIPEAPGETWSAVSHALRRGNRGLPGGSSLALLLAEKRDVRNTWTRPDLSIEQVLAWADAFHERTGSWPGEDSGDIPEAPGETWSAVSHALREAAEDFPVAAPWRNGLPSSGACAIRMPFPGSPARASWSGRMHISNEPGTGQTRTPGRFLKRLAKRGTPSESALRNGRRGFRGGSSLARLLARHRGRRNQLDLPSLSQRKILAWADTHRERTGSLAERGLRGSGGCAR